MAEIGFPSYPHRPGTGTIPDRAALDPIKARCPISVSDANWTNTAPYLHGFMLYAQGFYWEAHEVWEPVWLAASPNSRERRLLAALIQTTNAALKLVLDRPAAALRLLREAGSHVTECRLAEYGSERDRCLMGLDLVELQSELGACETGLECSLAARGLVPAPPRLTVPVRSLGLPVATKTTNSKTV